MKVSVSFLNSRQMSKDLINLNLTDVDYIHVDVMDGNFVKNKTLPFKKLKSIYKYTSKRLDVHLMVDDPNSYIDDYATLNTEYITIHLEIKKNIKELLDKIKKYGIKCGLAIKPTTSLITLEPYFNDIDMILVMGVEPGYGGQEFIAETAKRIAVLKNLIKERGLNIVVNTDGGINSNTRHLVNDADIIVSGSYVINNDNFQEAITSLR